MKQQKKRDYVRELVNEAAQEAMDWETEELDEFVKKAKAVKDISDADKNLQKDKIDAKFVTDQVVKVGLFAAFAVWEERHVIGRTLSTLMRRGL